MNQVLVKADSLTDGGKFLLVGTHPSFIFRDGKRTSETDGYRATVVTIPSFDRFNVKIPGKEIPADLANENILRQNSSGKFLYVSFTEFSAKIWTKTGEMQISATASDMQICHDNSDSETIEF